MYYMFGDAHIDDLDSATNDLSTQVKLSCRLRLRTPPVDVSKKLARRQVYVHQSPPPLSHLVLTGLLPCINLNTRLMQPSTMHVQHLGGTNICNCGCVHPKST